jgi:peptide deformylase
VSLLDIHVLGSPILRQETKPVDRMTDELRRLADDMFETMHAAKGIGLAAPQIGRLERLAVIDIENDPIVIVNPEIILTEGAAKGEEGCLSIPEVFGDVERATKITVRALDRDGKPFELEATDLLARCLQHEIDHLHGKLFLDYLSFLKRRSALSKWESMKKDFPQNIRKLPPGELAGRHGEEAL